MNLTKRNVITILIVELVILAGIFTLLICLASPLVAAIGGILCGAIAGTEIISAKKHFNRIG